MRIENVYGITLSPYVTAELQKKNPELCYMFRMYLKKWLGGEYWHMWMEVDKFKEMELDPISTRIMATQIFDKYWAPSSEYNIGIIYSNTFYLVSLIESNILDLKSRNASLKKSTRAL